MICDRCKSLEAKFHFVQIINNDRTESHLCAACHTNILNSSYSALADVNGGTFAPSLTKVGESTVINPFHKSVISDDLFSGFDMFSGYPKANFDIDTQKANTCDNCGVKSNEVASTGILGCPSCYYAFYELLLPAIQKAQNATEHTGRRPQIGENSFEARIEYEKYNALIREALAKENYEEAQRLKMKRDKISGGHDHEKK